MLRLTRTQQHVFSVVAIVVAGMALWLPSLDAVSLNPDESQYEATASYLIEEGESAFLPNGAPGTFLLFKILAWLFGPYPTFEMRVLLQLTAIAVALLLYDTVGRASHRAFGLLAGLVFLHGVTRFQGFAVNREWFAVLFTMAGLALYLAVAEERVSRPRAAAALAGFLCGMALWFKLQVSFMVFAAPLALALDAWNRRDLTRAWRVLLPFACGGIGSGLVYLAPFAWQGTLGQFLGFVFSDVSVFVGGNEQAVLADAGGSGPRLLAEKFYFGLPYRPLFLVAYVFAAGALVVALARRANSAAWIRRPAVLVFATLLPLSMNSVQLGHRFFLHYYQLMLPAVAALLALAAYGLARPLSDRAAWRAMAAVLLFAGLADRIWALSAHPLWQGKVRWPEAAFAAGLAVAAVGVVAYWALDPRRRSGTALAAWIVAQSLLMAGVEQLRPAPVSMQHSAHKFERLSGWLRSNAQPGDRLFVWGWAPEIYSLSKLVAGSHLTFCQYVANDLQGVPDRPSLNDEWAALLMDELHRTRPRFIVDAAARSWFETERDVYELDNFPQFELNRMLADEYALVETLDGCDVWERRR